MAASVIWTHLRASKSFVNVAESGGAPLRLTWARQLSCPFLLGRRTMVAMTVPPYGRGHCWWGKEDQAVECTKIAPQHVCREVSLSITIDFTADLNRHGS